MAVYTMRRLLAAIPVLLAASVLCFLLIDLSGDPLGDLRVAQPPVDPAVIASEEVRMYLDRSVPQRYLLWMTGIGGNGDIGLLQGKFGPSVRGPAFDIGAEIGARFLITLRLVVIALMMAIGLAIVSGVISAVKQYSTVDYLLTFTGFLALAMPAFWIGALIKEGGVWANRELGTGFATIGAASADTRGFTAWESFTDAAAHLFLPTLALMLTGYAALSRYQRASMLEVLNSDYVRLARAKGVRNRVVIRRHALRTALIPLTTVSALVIAGTIDGAIIIERIFQWRGLGDFFLESVSTNDSYSVMGWLMLSGIIVVTANLVADLLYGVLDPRIRYG
ncbi:ABC transporter permease [Phytoactinopolyspora limicola]|uniref:ABC transporter permease n=1 Tax=Phytoactinopolyspora limicola TaxID=2715536 RepID=UPI001407FB30|nr:ABC transporter permease [Phytoactinopolyspora limicola]